MLIKILIFLSSRILIYLNDSSINLFISKRGKWKEMDLSPKVELSPSEKMLFSRFQHCSSATENISWIIKYWNRRELQLIRQMFPEEDVVAEKSSQKKGKKDPKKAQEEIELEEARNAEILEQELAKAEVGIPEWNRQTVEDSPDIEEYENFLPDLEEVREGLGLGKNGPAIPAPVEFSVVPYPGMRENNSTNSNYFTLVAMGQDDPNLHEDDKIKEEIFDNSSSIPEVEPPGSSKKKKRGSRSSAKKESKSALETISPDMKDEENEKVLKLAKYRWVLEPGQEVTLKVRFSSNVLGSIDRTLAFEIVGTRKRLVLFHFLISL
jgi:hydrocephalus-inducing protein